MDEQTIKKYFNYKCKLCAEQENHGVLSKKIPCPIRLSEEMEIRRAGYMFHWNNNCVTLNAVPVFHIEKTYTASGNIKAKIVKC